MISKNDLRKYSKGSCAQILDFFGFEGRATSAGLF